MLMIDERFNATLILRFPTTTNELTTARMGTRLVCLDVPSIPLGVCGVDGEWVGGVLFWVGRFVSSQQQGRHSTAWQRRSWRASSMFLLRGLPVTDGTGVLYEYASIALADMYSTELAGVKNGWAASRKGLSRRGDSKWIIQELGLG